MKPEAQRIAIAEWCGWRHDYDTTQLKAVWISPKSGYAYELEDGFVPDYLNDLNAIHEAESKLTEKSTQDTYCLALAKVCNGCVDWDNERMNVVAWVTMRATAAQRAEALLRMIGKWTDATEAKQ